LEQTVPSFIEQIPCINYASEEFNENYDVLAVHYPSRIVSEKSNCLNFSLHPRVLRGHRYGKVYRNSSLSLSGARNKLRDQKYDLDRE
jgi:hypothetical protein